MMQKTIELTGLSTGYKSKGETKTITTDINEALLGGELTCLLGPNGAGKSTLLKTLSGFLPPVGGSARIMGKPLAEYTNTELAKQLGVVLTEKPMLENMTVEELIGLGRSPYTNFWGSLDDADREIVDNSIRLVGIDDLRGRMVSTLSDGERQKVMIAKALAQHTPIIFLDEPTAFLDYPSKVEIMLLLLRLAHEEGKTIFLSTHDLEIALQIADKCWLLDKWKGLTTGSPQALSDSGDIAAYFQRPGITYDPKARLFHIDTPSWHKT